jgi:hypothetical protein
MNGKALPHKKVDPVADIIIPKGWVKNRFAFIISLQFCSNFFPSP